MNIAHALSAFLRQCALLFLVFFACSATRAQQELLTNENIVNMTKAHLGDKLIVDMIQSSPAEFVVTSTALIALKQQGVSDGVIAAMRAKMVKTGKAPAPAPRGGQSSNPPPRPARPAIGRWEVRDTKDAITGESHFEAVMSASADDNGRHGTFGVTATCNVGGLAFKIVYHSDSDPKLGYLVTNGNVIMRLSIDDRAGSAPSITARFTNEATLWFQRKMTPQEQKDLGTAILVGLVSLTSPATPTEVYGAKLIRVEMPLNNGDRPIFEIRPQDPDFRKFVSRCQAQDNDRLEAEKAHPITADEFTARLEEALAKRGLGLGSPPSQYGAALKRLSDIVHVCASISPTEFANSVDRFGNIHLADAYRGKYSDCVLTDWAIRQTDPRFSIEIDLERFWQREEKRWDGATFRINVYLTPDLLLSADIKGIEGAPAPRTDPERQPVAASVPIIRPRQLVGQLICVGTTLGELHRTGFNLVIKDSPAKIVEVEPGDILFKLDGLGDRLFFLRSGLPPQPSCPNK